MDFDTAAALIERDVPFLLVTVDVASAHAQVVIGVDATRRTLIIRDPMSYRTSEYDADALFENHRAYGPRGHVILPPERAAALDGVTLPESELHDLAHALRLALETHESARIDAALANLRAMDATHPLTLWAARGVAAANEDPYAVRECSEALLARFPDAVNAELSVLDCLAQTGTEAEQRARIEARLEEPRAPWVFRERYARLLASDAADHERALRLAWRAHRAVPLRGHTIALLADIERARGRRERSLGMLRAAAALEPTDDEIAWSYFQEAFQVGAAEDALAFLMERGERFAQRSGQPISLVFRARLPRVGRKEEALAACERPVDSYFARGSLRARRAWVKWEFGEQEAACLEMRRVIADHPDQVLALRMLLEWETQREQHEAAVRIARELVKVAPLDAQSFGFLGHAELAAKHVDAAWDALSQAAEMDPSYAFAGNARIRIALERRRLSDAESVLTTQGPHVPAPMREAWEVAIAARSEDPERAERALARMVKHSVLPVAAVSLAAEEFSRFSVTQFRQVLRRVMSDPNAHAEIGALWVRTYADDQRSASPFVIARLAKQNPEAARLATRAFFEQLGDKRSSTLVLSFALLVLGKLVRKDDVAWGKVGYALLVKRAYVLGQLWLSSYRARRGVEPWMLANYRHAALENHQPQRALAASEYALTFSADETLGSHLAFVAFGRAANGDLDGAHALLEGLELGAPTGRDGWCLASARSLVQLDRAAPEERDMVLMELRARAGGSVFSGMGLFSTGQLHRWLAAGVLRQGFDAHFFFRRWGLWLTVALFASRVSMYPNIDTPGALRFAVALLILYGIVRIYI